MSSADVSWVPPRESAAALAALLILAAAGPVAAEPAVSSERASASAIAFSSKPADLVTEPRVVRPEEALLRATLAGDEPGAFVVEADKPVNAAHGPARRQKWRVLLGWRWNF